MDAESVKGMWFKGEIDCPACRKPARVPCDQGSITVKCPHCDKHWDYTPSTFSESFAKIFNLFPEPQTPRPWGWSDYVFIVGCGLVAAAILAAGVEVFVLHGNSYNVGIKVLVGMPMFVVGWAVTAYAIEEVRFRRRLRPKPWIPPFPLPPELEAKVRQRMEEDQNRRKNTPPTPEAKWERQTGS